MTSVKEVSNGWLVAGAVAQGQNATPAALGASASVVLNNLIESVYGESSSQLTAEERQARKNLVTTLISGTTQALGGDAALANAAAAIETENNSAATVTLGGMAVIEPISTAALIAGSATAAAAALVGGEIYLLKEEAQNSVDADAILAGNWSLEQVMAHRGRRCAQAVELQVMSRQFHSYMTLEEKLFLHETLSLRNHDISKRELAALGKKYLPLGFQGIDPLPTILPGAPIQESAPTLFVTPIAEPQPTILPGAPIPEVEGPTIFVTPAADPLPTHTGGIPLDDPLPNSVMFKNEAGIDNRLPIPETKGVTADNGLSVHSNEKHTPGGRGFGPQSGIEPKNSLELFGNSGALPKDLKHRYTKDPEGNIHRFSQTSEGLYHWSGGTADKQNPLDLSRVQGKLQKEFGWKIK